MGCYYKPYGAELGLEFNSGEDMSEFGSSTTKTHFKEGTVQSLAKSLINHFGDGRFWYDCLTNLQISHFLDVGIETSPKWEVIPNGNSKKATSQAFCVNWIEAR